MLYGRALAMSSPCVHAAGVGISLERPAPTPAVSLLVAPPSRPCGVPVPVSRARDAVRINVDYTHIGRPTREPADLEKRVSRSVKDDGMTSRRQVNSINPPRLNIVILNYALVV